MSDTHTTEVLTGGVVLAAAVGFFFFAGQVIGVSSSSSAHNYLASFRSADGISIGTDVRLGGVKVGTVSEIELNPQTFRAEADLSIDKEILLPEDTAAVISSEGLLGGSFVEILPGGSTFNLEPGSEIEDTQGAVSLVQLLLKFAAGGSDQ